MGEGSLSPNDTARQRAAANGRGLRCRGSMSSGVASTGFEQLERTLEERRLRVEAALQRLVEPSRAPAVRAAVEDSLFAPAKRLRPILSLLVAEVLRGNPDSVLPAACAI